MFWPPAAWGRSKQSADNCLVRSKKAELLGDVKRRTLLGSTSLEQKHQGNRGKKRVIKTPYCQEEERTKEPFGRGAVERRSYLGVKG